MGDAIRLPIISELVPSGLRRGAHYLVEFETHSLWYETSFMFAARALAQGTGTDYHTFIRSPNEVRASLEQYRLKLVDLEKEGMFRILDSYTIQAGGRIGISEHPERFSSRTLDVREWAAAHLENIKAGPPDLEKGRLLIDDNSAILLRYNNANDFIDLHRTSFLPYIKSFGLTVLEGFALGVASEDIYRQLEALSDGIFEFAMREEDNALRQYVRIRMIHGKTYDPRWRPIRLYDDGIVGLETQHKRTHELGIKRWIRGRED